METSWYQGTADAVYQKAIDIIRAHNPEFVLILAGDHIYKMDYGTMLAALVEAEADITVGCMEVPLNEARAFGVMSVDADQRIVSFAEKPQDPAPLSPGSDKALASMGIYVFRTDALIEELLRDADTSRLEPGFWRRYHPGRDRQTAGHGLPFLTDPGGRAATGGMSAPWTRSGRPTWN
ncbi:MAG: sugar phosphate nucleotidyltransferase [Halioglobus sp.]